MACAQGPQQTLQAPSVVLVGDSAPRDPGREAVLAAVLRALDGAAPVTLVTRDPHRAGCRRGLRVVSPTELRSIVRAVRRAAAVVFVGDTLLGARRGRRGGPSVAHLNAALSIAAFAHATRASVLAVGLASADLGSPVTRALVREFVRRADLTVLRDDESARALVRAGVPAPIRVGADPAWTLTDDWPRTGETDADVVFAVSSAELSAAQLGKLHRLGAGLAEAGLQVRLDDWGRAGDTAPAVRRLAGSASPLRFGNPPGDLAGASAQMAGARLVVTGRLHGQIAAAVAGVPCLSLELQSGQQALASRLGQWSQSLDGPGDELAAAAHSALGGPPAADAAVKSEIAAAHASLDLLRLMVGLGDVPVGGVDGLRLEWSGL